MNRLTISLRFLLHPNTSRRFKIDRAGIFHKPMRVIPDNPYWAAKYKRYAARFKRTR